MIDKTLAASAPRVGFDTMSEDQNPMDMDSGTVQALVESAKEGDVPSIVALFKLQTSIQVFLFFIFQFMVACLLFI